MLGLLHRLDLPGLLVAFYTPLRHSPPFSLPLTTAVARVLFELREGRLLSLLMPVRHHWQLPQIQKLVLMRQDALVLSWAMDFCSVDCFAHLQTFGTHLQTYQRAGSSSPEARHQASLIASCVTTRCSDAYLSSAHSPLLPWPSRNSCLMLYWSRSPLPKDLAVVPHRTDVWPVMALWAATKDSHAMRLR